MTNENIKTTKAIMTIEPQNFQQMVLQLHQERPQVTEHKVAKDIEMTSDEFLEFVSFFDKPRDWLADFNNADGLIRVTAPNFPIALIVDPGAYKCVYSVGFEITEE
jgi:hypothetical protein